jgi:hypothetical protein
VFSLTTATTTRHSGTGEGMARIAAYYKKILRERIATEE